MIHELDQAATSGHRELPAGRHPAFQRHGITDIRYEHSRREPEWSAACRVAGRQAEVDLPSLHIGGWYDIFSQGTLDNFAASHAAGRPTTLIMGPWTHLNPGHQIGDVSFGMAASTELLGFRGRLADIQSTWLRQCLTLEAAPSGPELPPVLLFVMGRNEWREEQQWPLARAVDTDLFLRAGSALTFNPPLADEGSESYVYDPADPVPTTGGALLMTDNFRPGPLDQAPVEARPDVLTYTTEPLTQALEVTGRIRAILHAVTDAPTPDWVARLCDVDTAGVSRNIVDGIVRSVTTPGESTEHAVDLWSTSHVFLAGHRIRVHVTSSNFPRCDRNLNTRDFLDGVTDSRPARQEIAHDAVRPSRIVLPVVSAPAG